jgi:sugar phosphate isomerase/epimerase
MQRREFLTLAAGVPFMAAAQTQPQLKLGIDLFSIRSQNWSPIQYLDYCAKQNAKVVHFSEVRFIGGLEEANLKRVRQHAEELGIEVEIGMRSICPTSKMFDASQGTAEEQVAKMVKAATTVGSHIVRSVLGSMEDRKAGQIERNIESMVKVLRNSRSVVMDANLKMAIENHAGDMQARELKMLVEEAGKDFVGVCLDSGNPLWTIEDPHLTLDTLHPYVLTSHVRDSAVWRVPEGAAVAWTRMGEGNVGIDDYVRKYAELCPGKALSMECIVTAPRIFAYRDPKFWDAYRNDPAWEFERFAAIAERGKPHPYTPPPKDQAQQREREDLEASIAYTKKLFGMATAAAV